MDKEKKQLDLVEQLEELGRLHETGLLSKDTYQAAVGSLQFNFQTEKGLDAAASKVETNVVGDKGVMIGGSAHAVVTGDNNSINLIINQYTDRQKVLLDADALRQQIINYLTWVTARYGHIELRGIKYDGQQVVQLKLEAIYVPLAAQAPVRETEQQHVASEDIDGQWVISLDQLLGLGPRLAVTGGPGCGKTTVLLYLAWTLAQALLWNNPDDIKKHLGLAETVIPLPIYIPLNAYAGYRRELTRSGSPLLPQQRTLAAFISHYLIERQSDFSLPDDFFQRLLRTGQQVILLLDGLDEVPDESERIMVRQAVEELVVSRNQIRVVLTCRTVAYAGRTILGKGFQEIQVLPLTETHVVALIKQACAVLYPTDEGKRQNNVMELLDGIKHIETERQRRLGPNAERLISSPLLVRMLLMVHFRDRRLPEQRVELYEKATNAFLLPEHVPDEEVAERLGRLVGESPEVHQEMIQYLAFYMHVQGETQEREINEAGIRSIFSQQPAFAPFVNEFLTLIRLRGTLLEERFGMYRFMHLAFQEYLVARYMAGALLDIDHIIIFLVSGVALDSWWREPILLLIGHLNLISPIMANKMVQQMAVLQADWTIDIQTALLELATAAMLEWPRVGVELHGYISNTWQKWLGNDLNIQQTKLRHKVQAGQTLAKWGDPREEIVKVDRIQFCAIPAGPFWMGNGDENSEVGANERPLHQVDLPYDYWMSQYPISNAQYQVFVEAGGYEVPAYWQDALRAGYWKQGRYRNVIGLLNLGSPFNLPNHPAVGVSWYEGLAFCRWLTERWHRAGLLSNDLSVQIPTEAEWEKGVRGGLTIPDEPRVGSIRSRTLSNWTLRENPRPTRLYPWGNTEARDMIHYLEANFNESNIGTTCMLGVFPKNESVYGLRELSGQVWEWTRSRWQDYPYHLGSERDSVEVIAEYRVQRGGSFVNEASQCRSSYRGWGNPYIGGKHMGFRVVVSRASVDVR